MFLLSCSLKQKKENDEQQTHIHRRRSDLREFDYTSLGWKRFERRSLNNVISQFRKKFRSDEHIHISTHPCIGYQLDSWRTTQPGETEPDSALPANNFYIIHHSPNTIRDIGSTSWYIYFPMKANERNIVTVITKKSIAQITERQKLPRIRSFLSSTTNFPLPFFE